MSNRTIKREIEKERRGRIHFWGLLIAFNSLLYGQFIINHTGFLTTQTEVYFHGIPEQLFGYGLLVFGTLKAIGVVSHNKHLRKWSIIGLSSVWSGLFVLSFTYSFGSGYPHPSWIYALFSVIVCWRISLKGEFDGL